MADVLYSVEHSIATITLNRPDKLNAVRRQTLRELTQALEESAADTSVRAVIMTGNGRAFTAGKDLDEMFEDLEAIANWSALELRKSIEDFHDLTRIIMSHPAPVVCAVNGVATGVGAELQLAADVRIASTNARIGFPEAQRALFETNGVTWLLPRLIGHGHAQYLLLTGELIDAARGAEIGLFNEVVEPERLMPRAMKIATRLATNAPLTVQGVKRAFARTWEMDLATAMEHETRQNIACLRSQDLREGITAFLEKRPPAYRGR